MLSLLKQIQDKIKTVSKTHPPQPTYRSKIKVIHVMNVYNMLSHGDTPMCQIWYAYVKE